MDDLNIENIALGKITHPSTTLPPSLIDLKLQPGRLNILDDFDDFNSQIIFSGLYYQEDIDRRSPVQKYFLEYIDIDTQKTIGFIQPPTKEFRFWEGIKPLLDGTEESDDMKNYLLNITPVNDFGKGAPSRFILPFKDLAFYGQDDPKITLLTALFEKNWKYFSENPYEAINRPKSMLIYIDVPTDTVTQDRDDSINSEHERTCQGDWKFTNFHQYRWVLNNENNYRLAADGWHNLVPEELSFIEKILKISAPYRQLYLAEKGIGFSGPYVFKLLIPNPLDNLDSIVLYIIKDTEWTL